MKKKSVLIISIGFFLLYMSFSAFSASDSAITSRIRGATVKIRNTSIRTSYYLPWRMKSEESSVGTGVIIEGNKILTNAHVVSDSTYIEVQKENDPLKYKAELLFIGHQCDLALLSIKDPKFFDNVKPLGLGKSIPELESTVLTYGYPEGGDRISITEGVVSRIELSTYSHSMRSSLLAIQTDAAINPGNSGGPVVQNGNMVGLAFQILSSAENIGYIIPTTVIRHFLDDIADGKFDGFPMLDIYWEKLENDDYRNYLGMSGSQSGILLTKVSDDGASFSYLKSGDVVLKIAGVKLANDGSIPFESGRISFSYLNTMRQVGERLDVEILRNKKTETISLPLSLKPERLPTYNEFETFPRYFIYGGIIFQPLCREFLKSWKDFWYEADPTLLNYYYYSETDDIAPEREEFVIINHVLPDPANTYVSNDSFLVVDSINGKKIKKLEDTVEAFKNPINGFHVIRVDNYSIPIVIKASVMDEANKSILAKYGIRSDRRF